LLDKVFYIYRFLDKNGKILYIGRTNDIERRILKEHFTAIGHLPEECYMAVEKVEYARIVNESEEVAYEAILINKLKPKYNIQFNDEGLFDIKLPEFEWKPFVFKHDYHLQFLKNKKNKVQGIGDFVEEILSDMETGDKNPITTGYVEFDSRFSLSKYNLILVAGDTLLDKTSYALSIVLHAAVEQGKRILYVNLREDATVLSSKLLSAAAVVPMQLMQSQNLKEEDWKKIAGAMGMLRKADIQFTNLSYEDKNIESIINTIKACPADLIIIDDLQSIVLNTNLFMKDKTVDIMQRLKAVSIDINTPVILFSQLSSQKIMSRPDHRPNVMDLEYDSMRAFPDIIKLLYLDELYYPDSDKKNIIEAYIAKSPFNSPHVFDLVFLKELYRIVNKEKISS